MSDAPPPPAQPSAGQSGGYQAQQSNGIAIGGFVTGLLGAIFGLIIPILALVLGIVGVSLSSVGRGRAKRGAPNGGLATAGLVLGILGIALAIVGFVAWSAYYSNNT